MTAGRLFIGTAGYQYKHWRDAFFPADLRKKDWFDFYARTFGALEVNGTFYNLPSEAGLDAWAEQAPPGFVYAPKFSRFGSHMKKLKDPGASVPPFTERVRRLGAHLGPVLVQLPGNWRVNVERLEDFLDALPDDMRWAVELRDASWFRDDVFAALEKRGVALVAHDMLADHPQAVTAGFVYLRFHGPNGDYTGSYTPQYLGAHAKRIRAELDAGRDVYAFFNNDAQAYAPHDAQRLQRLSLTATR